MLNSMIVTNYLGESLTINLQEVEPAHGLIIQSIDGIGPPRGILNMSDYATDDGSKWNSSRAEKRTITFTFLLTMIPDIEIAREITYKYFPLKKPINIVFETDHRMVECNGRVESNSPDIFTDKSTETIVVICEDPWFYKVGYGANQITYFGAIEPLFEFEFSNESLTEKLLEMSQYEFQAEQTVTYDGEVNTGIKMTIEALESGIGDITVYNITAQETMIIHTDKIKSITGTEFTTGDRIEIDSTDRSRTARLLRNGQYTNVINVVDRTSSWFELDRGENRFIYQTSTGKEDGLWFSMENRIVYEGV